MSTKDTGGQAFPCHERGGAGAGPLDLTDPGMTLRDYFASHANFGDVDQLTEPSGERLLGRPCPRLADDVTGCFIWWAEYRSVLRYIEADAMLKARQA